MLYLAAGLLMALAIAHSYLGERYILVRLFKRDSIPQLFGSTFFTKATLRFVWHLLTLAWLGFAVLMGFAADGRLTPVSALKVIGVTMLASSVLPLVISKGKHLSWVVLMAVGLMVLMGSAG